MYILNQEIKQIQRKNKKVPTVDIELKRSGLWVSIILGIQLKSSQLWYHGYFLRKH